MSLSPGRALLFLLALLASAFVWGWGSPTGTQAIIWLPTGIAIAGLWILGLEGWWLVALAAAIHRFTLHYDSSMILASALGSTAEAVVGVLLLRRFGVRASFGRLWDLVGLFVAAGLAPLASMACSRIARGLLGSGFVTPHYSGWGGWWWMNALGVLVVVPLAGTWSDTRSLPVRARVLSEGLAIVAAVVGIIWLVLTLVEPGLMGIILLYLTLPVALYG
ncbi:MAG: MASE1 domain-containing protein, partial [Gemmatimonadota bacterium]